MGSALRRFFDIRSGESLPVLLTFGYIGLVVASFLLAKPIRNALFLARYGAYNLAYVYIAVPVVLLLFVPIYTRLVAQRGHRAVITATLLLSAGTVVAFWYAFAFHRAAWLPAAFYIWVNAFGVVAPVQAWAFTASIFDTRQARRLFGIIGSGASLGAITGGLLARTLVGPVGGTVNLMLVMAGLIVLAAVLVNGLRLRSPGAAGTTSSGGRARLRADGGSPNAGGVRRAGLSAVARGAKAEARSREGGARRAVARQREGGRVPFRRTLALIGRTPYLRLVALLVLVVAIVTQWIGFQFSLAAEQRFGPNADRLTAFFGEFNFYLGAAAFLLQLFMTGPVLRRFGVALAILLLPAALGMGSLLIVLVPGLVAVLVTAGFDQALRFSTDKATYELLYLPLGGTLRSNVKATIDIVLNRAADAAGGVLLGLMTVGFGVIPGAGLGLRGTAAINLGLIAVWILTAVAVRRGYFHALRDSIQQHRLDLERASVVFDRSTADLVATKLGADDPRDILYALSLVESERARLPHPAVRFLLDHRNPEVRRRALAILRAAGDRTILPRAEAMLADPDLETRTEALLCVAELGRVDPLVRIRELGEFPDFSIQAGIVAFLAQPGPMRNLEAAGTVLDAMIDAGGPDARRSRLEAAKLLARLPDEFAAYLGRLVADPDQDVAREAIRSVGARCCAGCAAQVLDRVGDAPLTEDAVDALGRLCDPAVGLLQQRLQDPATRPEIRREIPEILRRMETPAAGRVLLEALLQPDATVRLRATSALNKLARARPELPIDRSLVETALAAEVLGHYRSYQILGTLGEGTEPDDPVVTGLRESMEREEERIFRLMGLLFPDQDLHSAYVGLRSESPAIRANAVEFLDHVLTPPGLRRLVVPLLDGQVSVAERAALAERLLGTSVDSKEDAVAALFASDDPWLKACAAYAVGALRLTALASMLDQAAAEPDPLVQEMARGARRRLAGEAPAPGEEPPSPTEWRRIEEVGLG